MQQGSLYRTPTGHGIRWREDGKRRYRSGFATKTAARQWFAENVAPRLRSGAPSNEIAYDDFCEIFLARHGATIEERSKDTIEERLVSSREIFGKWTLAELEGAAEDVAAWRAALPETKRYRVTAAMRQVLGGAVRWRYIARNPAVEAGKNPPPRAEELLPFTREEIDTLASEFATPAYGLLVVFAAETGLRTNE
jgi:hypothetical protein